VIGWGLFPPPGDAQSSCLGEIREFRARVLYEAGRRPAFRDADGSYADLDPLDQAAYHVYARVAGVIVGSVRLLPVSARDLCLTEQLIGPVRFAQMLRTLNVNRVETIEGGRWVVDPPHRVGRLGVLLAAAGVAVARALRYRMLVCPVGTGRKQDRVLARLGLGTVADVPLITVPHLDDAVRVMHVFPSRVGPILRELMDSAAVELKLPRTRRTDAGNGTDLVAFRNSDLGPSIYLRGKSETRA
jgi:Acetyltransferase (GNAT) domain